MRRVLTTILLLVSVASADTFVFDFETLGPTVPGPTLMVPDSLGSGAMMTITWSQPLEIENLSLFPGAPPTWGVGSLAVFGGADPFVVTFTGLTGGMLHEISWEIGDFTPSDTDDFIVTRLPTGKSDTGLLDGAIPPFNTRTLTVVESDLAGISTVLFGQTGGHSLFYDNFILNTSFIAPSTDVPMGGFGGSGDTGTGGDDGRLPPDGGNGNGTMPEPAALLLLGVGGAALALRRRR